MQGWKTNARLYVLKGNYCEQKKLAATAKKLGIRVIEVPLTKADTPEKKALPMLKLEVKLNAAGNSYVADILKLMNNTNGMEKMLSFIKLFPEQNKTPT
ncbi:MAG: hypothetical protein WC302_02755 [Candidatus Paceibacterota bacterium]|jgi:hypothetical protein